MTCRTKILLAAAVSLLCTLTLDAQNQQDGPRINKKNLVIREWNTTPKGTGGTLDHETTFNAEGRKIEEKEYNSDGKMKWRKRYEYDASGKVSKELVYDGRNRLQTYKTFEYNEFGRKKVQYTYDAKGKLLSYKKFEYIAQPAE